MTLRILGVSTAIICTAMLVFPVLGLQDAAEMARRLPVVAAAFGSSLDGENWGHHWRLSMLAVLVSAAAGTVAGVGMALRKRWSLALLGVVTGVLLLLKVGLAASGYETYEFERTDWGEFFILGAVVLACLLKYRRWSEPGHPAGNT